MPPHLQAVELIERVHFFHRLEPRPLELRQPRLLPGRLLPKAHLQPQHLVDPLGQFEAEGVVGEGQPVLLLVAVRAVVVAQGRRQPRLAPEQGGPGKEGARPPAREAVERVDGLLVGQEVPHEGLAEQGVVAALEPGPHVPEGLPQEEVGPLPARLLPAKALRPEALPPVPLQLDRGQPGVPEVLPEEGEAECRQVRVLEAAGPLLPEPLDSFPYEGAATVEGEEGDEGHEGGRKPNGEQLCGSENEVSGCNREEPCEVLLVLFDGCKYQLSINNNTEKQGGQEDSMLLSFNE